MRRRPFGETAVVLAVIAFALMIILATLGAF